MGYGASHAGARCLGRATNWEIGEVEFVYRHIDKDFVGSAWRQSRGMRTG